MPIFGLLVADSGGDNDPKDLLQPGFSKHDSCLARSRDLFSYLLIKDPVSWLTNCCRQSLVRANGRYYFGGLIAVADIIVLCRKITAEFRSLDVSSGGTREINQASSFYVLRFSKCFCFENYSSLWLISHGRRVYYALLLPSGRLALP